MELSQKQIEAIKQSGLLGANDAALGDDELYDAAHEALTSEAPVVRSYTAEQDKGAYSIVIRGVPGAYFVSALEYDDGVFDDLRSAEAAVHSHYGEFIIDREHSIEPLAEANSTAQLSNWILSK